MNKPLIFDITLNKTKPITFSGKVQNTKECPFCQVDKLTHILAKEGPIIWLMNKYPILRDTWPTVIIETDDDQGEFSRYSLEEASRVFAFCLSKWEETKSDSRFKSVLYFKNHGPMSGGSLRHPHSQIIGLYDYDYRQDVKTEHFQGWELFADGSVLITLSKQPLIGFSEYNIRFKPSADPTGVAKRLQDVIRYLLQSSHAFTSSYNYFFYDLNDGYYYIKVVPRYVTTPLYVGYQISQTITDEEAQKKGHDLLAFLR